MNNYSWILELPPIDTLIYCIKTIFTVAFTQYIFIKFTNIREIKKIKIITSILLMIMIALITAFVRNKIGIYNAIIIQLIFIFLANFNITKNSIQSTFVGTIIAFTISYILLGISIIVTAIFITVLNVQNDYIFLSIMVLIYSIITFKVIKIKKVKNGLIFLQNKLENDNINLVLLNISMILLYIIMIMQRDTIIKNPAIVIFVFTIIIIITIKKSLDAYYKQTLLIQDLKDTKAKLEEKEKEIEELEKENLDIGKRSHTLAHKQKILESKLDEIMNSEIGSEIDIKDEVKELSDKVYGEKKQAELVKTDVSLIDDVLKCMQNECISKNIDFELQVNGNIHYMINHFVEEEELQILIADHVKDAIIAIENSNNINRSILVKIGEVDGVFSLYIYDSGIEFKKEVLDKLGKEPITTHKEDGGTGMGFMNTFDTLRKHDASLVIKEIGPESETEYTKVIMIKFDNKNEFKIGSYK